MCVTRIPHVRAHWSSSADPSIAGGLPQVGRSKSSGIRDHHVSRRHVEVTVPAEREEGSAEGARAAAPRSCLRQLPARATCYSFECTKHSIGVSTSMPVPPPWCGIIFVRQGLSAVFSPIVYISMDYSLSVVSSRSRVAGPLACTYIHWTMWTTVTLPSSAPLSASVCACVLAGFCYDPSR